MIYPKWLQEGDYIGVTAVSDGVQEELDKKRFENGIQKLTKSGYTVLTTPNVYTADEKGRSSSGRERAEQFSGLIDDRRVKCVISAKGGNYLNEMLQHFDFEKMCSRPIWFQGYSDNTGLIHTLTTKYDIAAVYGNNFGDFGMETWDKSLWDNIDLLEGKQKIFYSYEKYQDGFSERVTGYEGYEKTQPVYWATADGRRAEFQGRLLGGCLDVLLFLQGTKYDCTQEFLKKYQQDGIIWYLESFSTDSENLMMFLWKLREIGWFRNCSGILLGRPLFYQTFSDTSYKEAVLYALGNLGVPIVFDCDFGHKPPRLPIINGAVAKVICEDGKGSIQYLE